MEVFHNWGALKEGDRVSLVGTPLILDNKGDHLIRTLETPCQEVVVRGSQLGDSGTIAFVGLVVKAIQPVPICCVDEETGVFPIMPCQMADMFRIVELCSGMGAFSSISEHCGFKVCAGVDQNGRWRQLFEACHPGATFLTGDCASVEVMKILHKMQAGHSLILAGISCQPHSRGGDKLGMWDSRSDSLPKALRMSWMLQSPITILECVPDVLHNQEFQKLLEDYCASTGCHLTQQVLRLSNFWPAKRDRWYACITAGILGPIRVPDLPICKAFSKVSQVVPYLQAWPQTDMEQLTLTELEVQKFRQFSKGGIEQRFIDMQGILPTCLHSAGNQIYACACGCRGPLSDRRLQDRGLYGTLVPIDMPEGAKPSFVCRYLHPREMFILNGGNPMVPFEDMRLSLGAVGQCVSPFHGVWMLSHVAAHLATFLKHEVIDPQYRIHQYLTWLLDKRDECWPPMHASCLQPCQELQSCMRAPFDGEQENGTSESQEIQIRDAMTKSTVSFRTNGGATVQQFVDAQSKLQGEACVWPCLDQDGTPATADMEVSHHSMSIGDSSMQVSSQDVPPCPCEQWGEISPTVPFCLEPIFEQSAISVDALSQLGSEALLSMVGPHVTCDNVEALVNAKIAKHAREMILSNQDKTWADDEIRAFLNQLVFKGPPEQKMVMWDPLIVSSMIAKGQFTEVGSLVAAIGSHATVVTAVVYEKHWCPLLWRFEPQGVLGFTCGLDFHRSLPLQILHNEICRCKQVPATMIVNRSIPFVVEAGCGAMAIAFLEHLVWGQPLPSDMQAVIAKHCAFRAMFRNQLEQSASRPWIWGAGAEELKAALTNLLKEHGVAFTDCAERVQMLFTKIGAPALEQAMKADQPWKELKWLANKQTPVVQIIRPSELQSMIEARTNNPKPIGNRLQKQHKAKGKGKGKGKGGHDNSFQVDPSKVRLEKGIFVCGDGILLSQLDVGQVGAQASGVVVCSATVAAPYLRGNRQISAGGLAFVVLASQESIPSTTLISERVRIPVLCAANAEPLLVDAFLFQLGAIPVRRYLAEDRFELTSVSSCVAKVAVYRDQIDRDWEAFVVHPLRHIFSKVPILEPCDDETCGGSCEKWHKSQACCIDHPILEMWGKQWMMLNFVGATPDKAEVFTVHIRVPLCIQQQLQSYSGIDGIFVEPKALDGRRPSESYQVIWMPKATIQDLTLLKQTQGLISGLARMGHKMGIRCVVANAAVLYSIVKPGSAFLPHGRKRFFLVGPVPFGTLKQSVSEALQTIGWVARVVSPVAAAHHVQGVMWKVQAVDMPAKTVLQLAHGEVVITCMEDLTEQQPVRANVVGADRTVQLCSAKDAVDQLQIHDPWANSARNIPKQTDGFKVGNCDPIEQIEKRVVDAVMAKLPRDSMEVDSTSLPAEVDHRIAELESKVNMLHDGHQRLHHAVQEQTAAQARLDTKVTEGAEQP